MAFGTGDGATGVMLDIIVWLPQWPIWAKIRPPASCTASVARRRPGMTLSSWMPVWLALACPRGSTYMCPVSSSPAPPSARRRYSSTNES